MSGFEYSPFNEVFSSQFTGLGTVFLAVYLGAMLLTSIYGIVVYILQSLGLYSIAKRRGIHHPWLAWIPVGVLWIMGSISDQYQYVAKSQVKNRRKTLLGLSIAMLVLLFAFTGFTVWAAVAAIRAETASGFARASFAAPIFLALIVYLAVMVIAIIATVYQHICLYNLYASCNPNNAVLFLVLGIFFNFLPPFFLFACRNKDLGMPPRKMQIPVAPWQPASDPVQTPVQEQPSEEMPKEE